MEQLFDHIPNTQAYLQRIGFDGEATITRDTLDRLVQSHQMHVPFENLEVYEFGRVPSLAIGDLYQKVVIQKRGGYCFELNGLFMQLLKDLGFQAYSCTARVLKNKKEFSPPHHRGIIVKMGEESFFCDVGFGGLMPGGSVALIENVRQEIFTDVYRIDRVAPYEWTLSQVKGEETVPLLCFTDIVQQPVDYIAGNYYCANAPDSYFKIQRMVNLRTKEGSYSLLGDVLRIRKQDQVCERQIKDKADLLQVLKEYFKMEIIE